MGLEMNLGLAVGFAAGMAATLLFQRFSATTTPRDEGPFDASGEPKAPALQVPKAGCTKWRVRNAEEIKDHWNIGELNMMSATGQSSHPHIKHVICSMNYDDHNLACVHNGKYFTGGHASDQTWAGDDTRRGQRIGGSWLGFEFQTPQKIHTVRMAQGGQDFPGFQSVSKVWLEAMVDGKWVHVGDLTFDQADATASL